MSYKRRHILRDPEPPLTELALADKLHEEASSFRAEALETLQECRVTLEKTQRFNDQANINQRRLALAVSSLLPKNLRTDFNLSASDIDNTAAIARENVEAISQRDAFDIVHAINVLAMANTDVIDVTIEYMGNVNRFYIRVFNKDEYIPSYRGEVAMGSEDALKTLLSIESQLTELIIEAREEAEAKAEVEA